MVEVNLPSHGGFWRPLIQVVILAPIYFLVGAAFGQSAGMLPQLMETGSHIRISRDEATWIASIPMIGMCVASVLSGPLSDRFGRIRVCQMAYLFIGVGNAVMLAANSFLLLVFGRFIFGLGQGCGGPVSIHISEVSPPTYRGLFLSTNQFLSSAGLVYAYAVGGYLPWRISVATMCLISVLGLVSTFFVYESPQWLVRKNRIDAARESISRVNKSTNADAKLKELQKTAVSTPDTKFTFSVFTMPSVWKPFLMIFVMFVLQNGCGYHIVIFYAVNFIREFRLTFDALQITMMIGVVRLLGTIVCFYLQRRLRRRIIGAASGFGSAVLLLVIYAYMLLEQSVPYLQQNSWIPFVFFTSSILTMTAGIYPVPMILTFEVFPIRVRGMMCGLTICVLSVVMFGTLKIYNILIDNLRIEGMILMFAVSSGLFGLFSVTVLVETHKKTLDEVEAVFAGNKGKEMT